MLKHYDFQSAQEYMYTKELLSAEEAQCCFQYMPAMAKAYLFHHSWNNTYLNLNVYSEVEKEAMDLRKEMGI